MTTRGWKKPACKRGHANPPRNSRGACKQCVREYGRENYLRDRDNRIRAAVARAKGDPEQRAYRIGVTVAEVRAAIAACGGACEACGMALTNPKMCVDHCHETGRIRGVLCRFCNALEGMLNKKRERVAQVMEYLDRKRQVKGAA